LKRKEKKKTKKRWFNTTENDIRAVGVRCVENQENWRFRTKVDEHK